MKLLLILLNSFHFLLYITCNRFNKKKKTLYALIIYIFLNSLITQVLFLFVNNNKTDITNS